MPGQSAANGTTLRRCPGARWSKSPTIKKARSGTSLPHCQRRAINELMKFAITIDRDEDGVWVVECPSIPGCVSQGKTKPEALKNIKEAIELCLEVRAQRGLPLTVETRQVEVAL